MRKRAIYSIVLILFFIFVSNYSLPCIELSEVMYYPNDSNEWLELYYFCNSSMSIEKLKIKDNLQEDAIECCHGYNCSYELLPNSFFVISENHNALANLNLTESMQYFCVDDNTIGNGLGNEKDMIILFDSSDANITYVNFSYDQIVNKGFSLALIDGKWGEGIPTPLERNVFSSHDTQNETELPINETNHTENKTWEDNETCINDLLPCLELSFIFDGEIYAKNKYHLLRLENNNYAENHPAINATLYFNFTKIEVMTVDNNSFFEQYINLSFKKSTTANAGEFNFDIPGRYLICARILLPNASSKNRELCKEIDVLDLSLIPCNISISIITQKDIFLSGEQIEYLIAVSNDTYPFEITYWIEDLFSNSEKEKAVTKIPGKKTYTPNKVENERALIIKANISKALCNNTNPNPSFDKLIAIKGNETRESRIEIVKITPQEISFGDSIEALLKIYKGDTSKTALSAYVWDGSEKISQATDFNIYGKNAESEISIPIQLFPNCEEEKPDGLYLLKVYGLNLSAEAVINVKGIKKSMCQKAAAVKKAAVSSGISAAVPIIEDPAKKQYSLLSYDYENFADVFLVKVEIRNDDQLSHSYDIWAYLYEGRNSLSGERESNMQKIFLEGKEEREVALKIVPEGKISNNTNLKIKILRDDRKTPYEITQALEGNFEESVKYEDITDNNSSEEKPQGEINSTDTIIQLQGSQNIPSESINDENTTESVKDENEITGEMVYESQGTNLKSYSKYMIFLLAFLLLGYYCVKKMSHIFVKV